MKFKILVFAQEHYEDILTLTGTDICWYRIFLVPYYSAILFIKVIIIIGSLNFIVSV